MAKTEAFEKYSDRYDEWFERNYNIYDVELEAIRQVIPPPPGIGLEVGVGSGKFAVPLGITIGVEPSKKMAIKAERQGIKVYPDVAENLPFKNSEFDFLLMVTTICFVDDILQSFREAFRVLKPNGYIIIGFIDRESELGKKYNEPQNRSVFYKDATFFTPQEVSGYLKDAGFVNLTFRQTLIPEEKLKTIQEGFGKGAFVIVKGMKT
jgi:SAM-dependent methyltransferase